MYWSLKTCRTHPLFFGGCWGGHHWRQTPRMGIWAGNNDLDKCPLGMQLASVEDPWSSADDDPWGTVFFPQSLYYSGSTSLEIKGFLKNLLYFLYWSSNDVFIVGKSKSQYKLKQFKITLSFTIWRAPRLVFCRIIFQTVFQCGYISMQRKVILCALFWNLIFCHLLKVVAVLVIRSVFGKWQQFSQESQVGWSEIADSSALAKATFL